MSQIKPSSITSVSRPKPSIPLLSGLFQKIKTYKVLFITSFLLFMLVVVIGLLHSSQNEDIRSHASTTSSGLHLLVPAYWDPNNDWQRLQPLGSNGGIAIMNLNDGPVRHQTVIIKLK